MVDPIGIEPAALRLLYTMSVRFTRLQQIMIFRKKWWTQSGSNRRPLACHASALPTELWAPKKGWAMNIQFTAPNQVEFEKNSYFFNESRISRNKTISSGVGADEEGDSSSFFLSLFVPLTIQNTNHATAKKLITALIIIP